MVIPFSERKRLGKNSNRGWVWKLMFDQSKFKVIGRHLREGVDLMVGYLA